MEEEGYYCEKVCTEVVISYKVNPQKSAVQEYLEKRCIISCSYAVVCGVEDINYIPNWSECAYAESYK